MPKRLIQVICPAAASESIKTQMEGVEVLGRWRDRNQQDRVLVQILAPATRAEAVMDSLQHRLANRSDCHFLQQPVDAALPPAGGTRRRTGCTDRHCAGQPGRDPGAAGGRFHGELALPPWSRCPRWWRRSGCSAMICPSSSGRWSSPPARSQHGADAGHHAG